MGNNIIFLGEDDPRKPKEEKKQEQPRRHRRRGSGKNKKKLQDEAIKKFKEDNQKRQKATIYWIRDLAIWGLPAGLIFWFILNKAVHLTVELVAQWANAMAALLK